VRAGEREERDGGGGRGGGLEDLVEVVGELALRDGPRPLVVALGETRR